MDYSNGQFSAGIQIEAYLPALYGYEIGTLGNPRQFMLASKYVRWTNNNLTVHIGDIYDQLGNGLLLRSYEDRHLGFSLSRVWPDVRGYTQTILRPGCAQPACRSALTAC